MSDRQQTPLADLIARIEQAAGPDRELDAEIMEALGHQVRRNMPRRRMAWCWLDGSRWRPLPMLTASVDAALSLFKQRPTLIHSEPLPVVRDALRQMLEEQDGR